MINNEYDPTFSVHISHPDEMDHSMPLSLPLIEGPNGKKGVSVGELQQGISLLAADAVIWLANTPEPSTERPPLEFFYGGLQLDQEKYQLIINGQVVVTPQKEYQLINFLMQNPGRIISRNQICESVWGNEYRRGSDKSAAQSLRVHICRIRQKLGPYHLSIVTRRGASTPVENRASSRPTLIGGYMFDPSAKVDE
ncbi:MAG: transcriptional regulator [Candidatus Saccharibacteria bacterium]|nr:transcriptional regulator [Candidatus Saccharibacteria bacterium]